MAAEGRGAGGLRSDDPAVQTSHVRRRADQLFRGGRLGARGPRPPVRIRYLHRMVVRRHHRHVQKNLAAHDRPVSGGRKSVGRFHHVAVPPTMKKEN